MNNLIDYTYFRGSLLVPNAAETGYVQQYLNVLIAERQEEILVTMLGAELYGRFVTWYNSTTHDNTPENKFLPYKEPEMIQVGVTANFIANSNTATINTWKGYEIYVERIGQGTMKKGVDYTWNKVTGVWTMLVSAFQPAEYFNVEFGRTVEAGIVTSDITDDEAELFGWLLNGKTFLYGGITVKWIGLVNAAKVSPLAGYVFYWWLRQNASQTTGSGEAKLETANARPADPRPKMCTAWNAMRAQLIPFLQFMDNYFGLTVGNWQYYLPHRHIHRYNLPVVDIYHIIDPLNIT